MNNHVSGKIAIVTGASIGIGRAIALAFAKEGFRLVLIARRQEHLDEVKRQIEGLGAEAHAYKLDLSDPKAIVDTFVRIRKDVGDAHVLVNNAGQGSLGKLAAEFTLSDYEKTFDLNVRAVFMLIKEVLPAMIKARTGTIINIGSLSGKTGKPRQALYSASKFALVGLTEAVFEEVKDHNIQVSLICPDAVQTEFNEKDHAIQPDDIAAAALLCVRETQTATIKEIVVRIRRPI